MIGPHDSYYSVAASGEGRIAATVPSSVVKGSSFTFSFLIDTPSSSFNYRPFVDFVIDPNSIAIVTSSWTMGNAGAPLSPSVGTCHSGASSHVGVCSDAHPRCVGHLNRLHCASLHALALRVRCAESTTTGAHPAAVPVPHF